MLFDSSILKETRYINYCMFVLYTSAFVICEVAHAAFPLNPLQSLQVFKQNKGPIIDDLICIGQFVSIKRKLQNQYFRTSVTCEQYILQCQFNINNSKHSYRLTNLITFNCFVLIRQLRSLTVYDVNMKYSEGSAQKQKFIQKTTFRILQSVEQLNMCVW